jgi:hypothetical protein
MKEKKTENDQRYSFIKHANFSLHTLKKERKGKRMGL